MSSNVLRLFPLGFPWETQDPFLFCVYHLDYYPKGNEEMGPDASLDGRNLGNDFTIKDGWRMYHGSTIPGFPYHPHRGFETITIVNKGFCDHSDSLGAAGRFGQGDVQWMTAGRGVQHSEMFPLINKEKENTLELFQIWLNLPKAGKFVDPHFKMLWSEDIPVHSQDGVTVKVIAGEYNGMDAPEPAPDSWAHEHEHHVAIWNIKMDANSSFTLPANDGPLNRSIYYYEGDRMLVDGQQISAGHGADLNAGQGNKLENGDSPSSLLLLQGRPIAEPVAKYGPFVMNTQLEIQQAMEDYQLTRFGGWPWPHPDPVHPRDSGRFAKYPDGKIEKR